MNNIEFFIDEYLHPPADCEYARLMTALKLDPNQRNSTELMAVMPSIRQSTWSQCVRNGGMITLLLLRLAAAIGVNPGYILCGDQPIYRPGYAAPSAPGKLPVKLRSPVLDKE